ncbi:hypothetical protein J6590_001021 [Homalodisca vitripennis]|nr:hypothetical protein J6590_001021 [Homalodisca vitripennis]
MNRFGSIYDDTSRHPNNRRYGTTKGDGATKLIDPIRKERPVSVLVVIAQQFISHNAPAVPGGSGSCVATSRRPVHSIGRRQLHSLVVPYLNHILDAAILYAESSVIFGARGRR